MTQRRGFTMIEMLVVLAFMVLIVGISIPAVANITRSEAASELGTFNAFLKKTFLSSMRRGEYLRIAINLRTGEYWAEKTETPFFLMTGKEQESYDRQNEALLEEYEEAKDSPGALKAGDASTAQNFFQLVSMQATDETMADDLYHWENFVPAQRDLREILRPEFTPVSEHRTLPSSLWFSQFFSYHTPDILTPEATEEDGPTDSKQRMAYIYLFPQGRLSPFYLSIGEKEGDTFLHLSADMFLRTRVDPGPFDEEVKSLVGEMEEDRDEEGK